MRKAEREDLIIVRGHLATAQNALMAAFVDRGTALGKVLDAVEIVDALLADKKEMP